MDKVESHNGGRELKKLKDVSSTSKYNIFNLWSD